MQEIDYDGFKIFMDKFLEIDTPTGLCQHLFLSFVRIPQEGNDGEQVEQDFLILHKQNFLLLFEIIFSWS